MRLPNSRAILVLVAAAFGFVAFFSRTIGAIGLVVTLCAILGLTLAMRWNYSGRARVWLARAHDGALVLKPPFQGRWRVVAGGPDPRHNPYVALADQYFAYDFVPVDEAADDAAVLAPCAGLIASVERRTDEFGTYVSIEAAGGYVLLSNLDDGSVDVRSGTPVETGSRIGRRAPGQPLHVHAQNSPYRSIGIARAIPIAFKDRRATDPLVLEFGDDLE